MRPRDGWEALSWALWASAALAYVASLAGCLTGCAAVSPRASLVIAADASNALADALETARQATQGRFVTEVGARCGVPAESQCAARVLESYAPTEQRHNALVLLQRSVADAIERATACEASGDAVCYQDALTEAQRSLARLREQVRP